jgi:hypothetical protein
MEQCENCIFKNAQDICNIKNKHTFYIDYEDCWYFVSKDEDKENRDIYFYEREDY